MRANHIQVLAVCLALSASTTYGALAQDEFPGVGSKTDWYAACEINTKANEQLQSGNRGKALALFKAAITKYSFETGFYNNLGMFYRDDGKAMEAEKAFRKAVELCEKYGVKYPDSYYELALLCEKRKATVDADKYFKKATQLWGTSKCWRSYGEFLKKQKRLKESAEAIAKADKLDKEAVKFR